MLEYKKFMKANFFTELIWDKLGFEEEITDNIRSSKMYSFCARKYRLHEKYNKHKNIFGKLNHLIVNFGTYIHSLIQNQYLAPIGILHTGEHGSWRCNFCFRELNGFMPKCPCDCLKTKANRIIYKHLKIDEEIKISKNHFWEYIEPKFGPEEDLIFPIPGHADGILIIDEKKYLLEIKTSNSIAFKWLKKPYDSYVVQTNIYMEALNLDETIVLFIDRGLSRENIPFKSFILKRNKLVFDLVMNKIDVNNKSKKMNIMPLRLEDCELSKSCAVYKYCEYNKECFKEPMEEYYINSGKFIQEDDLFIEKVKDNVDDIDDIDNILDCL